MKVLRTPDEPFSNLPDYPFEPHYAEIPDLEGGWSGGRKKAFTGISRR